MKFSEMPYTRPDTEKIRAQYDGLISRFKAAKSADEQIAIISEEETLRSHFMTEATLVSIRNSGDSVGDTFRLCPRVYAGISRLRTRGGGFPIAPSTPSGAHSHS